jgi:hypothetical protein
VARGPRGSKYRKPPVDERINLDQRSISAIIGKRGTTIWQIRRQCGVGMQVIDNRTVWLCGQPHNVRAAIVHIISIITRIPTANTNAAIIALNNFDTRFPTAPTTTTTPFTAAGEPTALTTITTTPHTAAWEPTALTITTATTANTASGVPASSITDITPYTKPMTKTSATDCKARYTKPMSKTSATDYKGRHTSPTAVAVVAGTGGGAGGGGAGVEGGGMGVYYGGTTTPVMAAFHANYSHYATMMPFLPYLQSYHMTPNNNTTRFFKPTPTSTPFPPIPLNSPPPNQTLHFHAQPPFHFPAPELATAQPSTFISPIA